MTADHNTYAQHDDVRLVDPMLLVTADEMFWAIRDTLSGHDWFDCWASINEAAALAVQTIQNTVRRREWAVSRICGRWTRAGHRCTRKLTWYEPACYSHCTPAEREQRAENLRIYTELRDGSGSDRV